MDAVSWTDQAGISERSLFFARDGGNRQTIMPTKAVRAECVERTVASEMVLSLRSNNRLVASCVDDLSLASLRPSDLADAPALIERSASIGWLPARPPLVKRDEGSGWATANLA